MSDGVAGDWQNLHSGSSVGLWQLMKDEQKGWIAFTDFILLL